MYDERISKHESWLKNEAFNAGKAGTTFFAFDKAYDYVSRSRVAEKSGILAEIIVAWMLGAFAKHHPDLKVKMSWYLDSREKTDFLVSRRLSDGTIKERKVQLNFNNAQDFHNLPKEVVLVRVGPSRQIKFQGKIYIERMWGEEVLGKILAGMADSPLYRDAVSKSVTRHFNKVNENLFSPKELEMFFSCSAVWTPYRDAWKMIQA